MINDSFTEDNYSCYMQPSNPFGCDSITSERGLQKLDQRLVYIYEEVQ